MILYLYILILLNKCHTNLFVYILLNKKSYVLFIPWFTNYICFQGYNQTKKRLLKELLQRLFFK